MENEVKNELILPEGATSINTDIFGEDKTKRLTTLDLNNDKDVDLMINSNQNIDFKLNDCIDKEIEVRACTVSEREVETVNEETGEVIKHKKHVLILFDTNDNSYVTGSNACYHSFIGITAFKGLPTAQNILTLIPIKVNAKESGHSYLKLKLKSSN